MKYPTKANDITSLICDLRSELTPSGQKILDRLIDRIVFELDCIRHTTELEKNEAQIARGKK